MPYNLSRILIRTIIFPAILFWNRYRINLNASISYMLAWHRLGKRNWSALWFKISDLESVSKFFTKCENQNHFVIPGRTSPENFGGPLWPVFFNRPIVHNWSLQSEGLTEASWGPYLWMNTVSVLIYEYRILISSYNLYHRQLQLSVKDHE